MPTIVQFEGVSKTFETKQQTVTAIDGIDLSIEEGEIFGVIGYSGAGKSTLVRLVNGLERITGGRLIVDGNDIGAMRESELRKVRLGIGMIFQQFNLFRSRTVAGNVAYPLRVAGWKKEARDRRVAELLDFVGLLDRAHDYPDQLSGGQKQRVGVARALATSPKLLLADESTSALDPETTQEVLRLLQKVNRELGVTIIVITHEMDVVRSIADRVAVLEKGKIVEQGAVFDIFSDPQTDTARRFISTVIRNQPSHTDLDRLQKVHSGRIVNVEIHESVRIGDILTHAFTEHGVRFEVVYGGIGAIQERSFGSLTLELNGPDDGIDAFLAQLRTVTTVEEVRS
ncbi:methionine ABC transporter ATP-binding protein [Compostimonas suwonensis]|uniref:methionine ABC transporter ATP-binding protein n=1 Tax=Compostimonas suwonensis TaxID=1048394 RepID=UPI001FE8D3C0|nr:methionine ABC transporter ATP-binding protein [Compostimonas suwonensis]